jgi:hypothetical protein
MNRRRPTPTEDSPVGSLFAWAPTAIDMVVILVVGFLLLGKRLEKLGEELGRWLRP